MTTTTPTLELFDIQHGGLSYFWIAESLAAALQDFVASPDYEGNEFDVSAKPVAAGRSITLREDGQLVTRTARQWVEEQGQPGSLASSPE